MRRFNLNRLASTVSICVLAGMLLVLASRGEAQSAISTPQAADTADAKAFRSLFRQTASYKALVEAAESGAISKPKLSHLTSDRFHLSDSNAAILENLAVAYQNEVLPLHQQALDYIEKFHARFPGGVIPKGADASPPTELAILQQQETALTLHYRDLLRESMPKGDFDVLVSTVRRSTP